MKKLFVILVAVVFSAGFVFAQNTGIVTETGDDNTAYIDQLGSSNNATITQIGDKNKADISDMYSSSLYGLLTGTKGITQQGDGNEGTITQTNGFTGLVNAGPIAGIGQYSSYNAATISQSHSGSWMQEYAWVKQQGGDHNASLQNQVYGYHFSHIFQDGAWNTAETQQQGGYNQKANILQSGNDNYAFQYQGLSGYTQSNLAEATQSGDHNDSYQYQYGSQNIARTIQSSNYNLSNLIQNGNSNDARIEQKTDDLNIVNLTQDGGANADILQDGDNNTVMGLNIDPMATSLNGSTLNVDQLGSSNTLHLQQTNGASATVMQDGVTNTSVIIQN